MIRVPKYREPTHPGEILLEEFLIPMGMSQQCLARSIRVPYLCINEIVNKRRGVAPATALAKYYRQEFLLGVKRRANTIIAITMWDGDCWIKCPY
jgi:addiction module HigA family antidote